MAGDDGLGGYATGTVCGLRTRRHHSLLTVAEPATVVMAGRRPAAAESEELSRF